MTDLRPVLIYGAGGHGRVVADIVERQGTYRIAGFIDDRDQLLGVRVGESAILGGIDTLVSRLADCAVVLAIGSNDDRERLAEELTTAGAEFVSAVHPSAQIGSDVTIGLGTVVMANAVINTGTWVGAHVIVNTSATIDHDCIVDDFAHLAPGVHLAGGVTVGAGSLVGVGGNVVPGVGIGCWSIVGAGATVLQDLPDHVRAVGTPAVPFEQVRLSSRDTRSVR